MQDHMPSTAAPIYYDELTAHKQRVFRRLLQFVWTASQEEVSQRRKFNKTEDYLLAQFQRRPRHAVLIDGARGAGKTTMLLTLKEYLKMLGRSEPPADLYLDSGKVKSHLRDIREEDPLGFRDEEDSRRNLNTTFVLPVLFPSDLEAAQPIMEGLFKIMGEEIDHELERSVHNSRDTPSTGKESRRNQLSKLREAIYKTVAKGWFVSMSDGVEAILQDSHNFDSYLENRGKASGASYSRVRDWREFVNHFLDLMGAQTLVVSIDDTDVAPHVSLDILHTLRIFLDHPRIVTLIAGNLSIMRQSMHVAAMSKLSDPIGALAKADSSTAMGWRRFQRQQLEEYLDKVLPRVNRHVLAPIDSSGEASDDFKSFTGDSFDDYCEKRLQIYLKPFLKTKLEMHFRRARREREIRSDEEHARIESHLSWWLMRHWYGEKLQPRTFRELKTFHWFTRLSEDRASKRKELNTKKRLPVMLFENPLNYELSQRIGDDEHSLPRWLHKQHLTSCWNGTRHFQVNSRRLAEGSYSYDLTCYWLDLAIATPHAEGQEAEIPLALLPSPDGRNLKGRPAFFGNQIEPMRVGVAEALDHSLVPTNCIFFYDLECLPDIAWEAPVHPGEKPKSRWTSDAIYSWGWPSLIERRGDRARSPVNWAAEEYLTEVVLPFASLEVGRFIATPREATDRGTGANLWAWEKRTDFGAKNRALLDPLRRRVDYMVMVARSGVAAESTAGVFRADIESDLRRLLESAFPTKDQMDDIGTHWISYQWLLNDVRRAWHASRITLNHIGEIIKHTAHEAGKKQVARHRDLRGRFSRRDRYRVLRPEDFAEALKQSEAISDFWAKASAEFSAEHGAFDKSWKDWRFEDVVSCIAGVSPTAPNVEKALRQSIENGDRGKSPFILFDMGPEQEQLAYGRVSRALFLFVAGFGPCIPSLIHIAFAGAHYAHTIGIAPPAGRTWSEVQKNILDGWERQIDGFKRFLRRYRVSLEYCLVRLEYLNEREHEIEEKKREIHDAMGMRNQRANEPSFDWPNVNRALIPDGSFSSLGLEGRAGLVRKWDAETKLGTPSIFLRDGAIAKLLLGNATSAGGESGRNLLADAEQSLEVATNYIQHLRRPVPEVAANPIEPGAPQSQAIEPRQ